VPAVACVSPLLPCKWQVVMVIVLKFDATLTKAGGWIFVPSYARVSPLLPCEWWVVRVMKLKL
jgi:hypothetical protein